MTGANMTKIIREYGKDHTLWLPNLLPMCVVCPCRLPWINVTLRLCKVHFLCSNRAVSPCNHREIATSDGSVAPPTPEPRVNLDYRIQKPSFSLDSSDSFFHASEPPRLRASVPFVTPTPCFSYFSLPLPSAIDLLQDVDWPSPLTTSI